MIENLSKVEILTCECNQSGINIAEYPLPVNIQGLYFEDDNTHPVITISSSLKARSEVCCVLAEELGHYHTSCGNLLTDSKIENTLIRQQEVRAKRWAIKKLVSFKNIIEAYEVGCRNFYEMSEYLEITEEFLKNAFKTYYSIYGKYKLRDKYIIYFDPPGVLKLIE